MLPVFEYIVWSAIGEEYVVSRPEENIWKDLELIQTYGPPNFDSRESMAGHTTALAVGTFLALLMSEASGRPLSV